MAFLQCGGGQASAEDGAEAHSGPMTHPFAGFALQGGGQHNSINRRTLMLVTRSSRS